MQKFRNTIFTLLFISVSVFSKGQFTPDTAPAMHVTFSVTDSSAPKFSVRVVASNGKRIKMTIYNDQGENLFTKDYSESFMHTLDFSGAGDGSYTVELYCSRERVRKRIDIATEHRTLRRTTIETK